MARRWGGPQGATARHTGSSRSQPAQLVVVLERRRLTLDHDGPPDPDDEVHSPAASRRAAVPRGSSPRATSTPSSSRSSRRSASACSSPGSTFPPGNSQPPASADGSVRRAASSTVGRPRSSTTGGPHDLTTPTVVLPCRHSCFTPVNICGLPSCRPHISLVSATNRRRRAVTPCGAPLNIAHLGVQPGGQEFAHKRGIHEVHAEGDPGRLGDDAGADAGGLRPVGARLRRRTDRGRR